MSAPALATMTRPATRPAAQSHARPVAPIAPLRVIRADRAGAEERRRAVERYMAEVEAEMMAAVAWIAMTSTTPEG